MYETLYENRTSTFQNFFGIILRFQNISSNVHRQKEKWRFLAKAQKEMISILAKLNLIVPLTRIVSYNADYAYKNGDQVLIYSEKQTELMRPNINTDYNAQMIWGEQAGEEQSAMSTSFQRKPFFLANLSQLT